MHTRAPRPPRSPHTHLAACTQILVIAVLMRSVLRRSFSLFQWEALFLLVAGITGARACLPRFNPLPPLFLALLPPALAFLWLASHTHAYPALHPCAVNQLHQCGSSGEGDAISLPAVLYTLGV